MNVPTDPLGPPRADPDAGRLRAVLHAAFFLLLAASLARYLLRHPGSGLIPWVVGLTAALIAVYVAGRGGLGRLAGRVWLTVLVGVWVVLVVFAPSFAWSGVPLFYAALRILPTRAALWLIGALTVLVVAAQLRIAKNSGDLPILILGPPAVAALAAAVFVSMQRQSTRQRALIDDLVRTRRELAAIERREGTLAERQRLAAEIHDTLAQGLSSQRMLLQAAERTWRTDPGAAMRHVEVAAAVTDRNLAEARRFVHDLAPADLAGGGGLAEALARLAERESGAGGGPEVVFRQDGTPPELPGRTQAALLRVAQGAVANAREHAGAAHVALTLSDLGDQVVLDVADDGRGFAPEAVPGPGAARGHGLPAMRARLRQLGGALTVESAPGEGTVLSAAVPAGGAPRGRGAGAGSGSDSGPRSGQEPSQGSGSGTGPGGEGTSS
ncbi:sensor histidine kinase [Streptomyces aculeolatus]